jgi:uncharacterized protein YjbJ (UPF0337 family)
MNKHQVAGTARSAAGKVEEGLGRLSGDVEARAHGKMGQVKGELEKAFGHAKDTAHDAVETVGEGAGDAGSYLHATIKEHPYTTAAMALGLGFIIGRIGSR